jgi:hypothetical protein
VSICMPGVLVPVRYPPCPKVVRVHDKTACSYVIQQYILNSFHKVKIKIFLYPTNNLSQSCPMARFAVF